MFPIGLWFQTEEQHQNTTSSIIDESLVCGSWQIGTSITHDNIRKMLVGGVEQKLTLQIVQRKMGGEVVESILLVFLVDLFATLGKDVLLLNSWTATNNGPESSQVLQSC